MYTCLGDNGRERIMAKRPTRTKRNMASTVSEQLREAIDTSGQSRYAICKALKIDQAQLSRFMVGQRGLSVTVLDRLCDYLGLELRPRRKR